MKAAAVLGALVLALTVFFYPAKVDAASPIQNSRVRVLNQDGTLRSSFSLVNGNAAGGFSVAAADLGGDGVPELVLGSGLGSAPDVIVTRLDGSVILRFPAYAANATMGINVAACDLDGDGSPDIITSAQRGGGPHIRVFNALGEPKASFFAYDAEDRNGVNLACGDLNGDGKADLFTLPAAGAEPLVREWTFEEGSVVREQEFMGLEPGDRRGTVGVVHGNQLIVSSQHASTVSVRTFAFASPAKLIGDVASDVDVSGVNSIAFLNGAIRLAAASDGKVIDTQGNAVADVDSEFGGTNATAMDVDGDGTQELVVTDGKPAFSEDGSERSIVVDLSEQRLYAYENGILINSFLVSTGIRGLETEIGKYHVLAKLPFVRYAGPGWDLGNVPWNLRIYPHHYLHYAYWHNNFGYPMSHGCVNIGLENMKWVYNWADVGVPVEIHS